MNLPLRFSAAPSPCETLKNSFLCSRQKNFFLFFRKTAEPRGASTRNQQEREQKRRDIGEDFSEKDWIKNTVAALHDRQRDGALRSFQEAELFWLRFWAVRLDVCAIMFRFHSRLSGFYGSVFFLWSLVLLCRSFCSPSSLLCGPYSEFIIAIVLHNTKTPKSIILYAHTQELRENFRAHLGVSFRG